jgi:hypothetical protein
MLTGVSFTRLEFLARGELDEQDELADDGRLRCYGCDSPYANFGTVESKSSREGRGRRSCRRSAPRPSTGNTDYNRARPG